MTSERIHLKTTVRAGQGGYGAHSLILSRYRDVAYAGYKDGTVHRIDEPAAPLSDDDPSLSTPLTIKQLKDPSEDRSTEYLPPVSTLGEWSDGVLLVGREDGSLDRLTRDPHDPDSILWRRDTLRRSDPTRVARLMEPLSAKHFLISTDVTGMVLPLDKPLKESLEAPHEDARARRLLCAVRFDATLEDARSPNSSAEVGWLMVRRDGLVSFATEDPTTGGIDDIKSDPEFWEGGDRPGLAIDYAVEKRRPSHHDERAAYMVEQRARSVCLLTDAGVFRMQPASAAKGVPIEPASPVKGVPIEYRRIAIPRVGRDCAVITACQDALDEPDAPSCFRLWIWDRDGRGVVLEADDDDARRWRFACDVTGHVKVTRAVSWSRRGKRAHALALGLQERVALFDLVTPKGGSRAAPLSSPFEYAQRVIEGTVPAGGGTGSNDAGKCTDTRETTSDEPKAVFHPAPPPTAERMLEVLRMGPDEDAHGILEKTLEDTDRWAATILMWVDAALGVIFRWRLEPREDLIEALCRWVRRLEQESLLRWSSLQRTAPAPGEPPIEFELAAQRAVARARKWGLEGWRFRDRPDLYKPRAVLVHLKDRHRVLRPLDRAVYETLMFNRRFDQAWHSRAYSRYLDPLVDKRLVAVRSIAVPVIDVPPERRLEGGQNPGGSHVVLARVPRHGSIHLWWRTSQGSRQSGIDAPTCRAVVPAPDRSGRVATDDAIFVPVSGDRVAVVRLAEPLHHAGERRTFLTAHLIDLWATGKTPEYTVSRSDEWQGEKRNGDVMKHIDAELLCEWGGETTDGGDRRDGNPCIDAIAPAGPWHLLIGETLRIINERPRTTLKLLRIDAEGRTLRVIGELGPDVIRSAYPASGPMTAANPVRCIVTATIDGETSGTESGHRPPRWYAIACADGQIWAGRLPWDDPRGAGGSTAGPLADPKIVGRVSGRPTALAMRIHAYEDPAAGYAIRIFGGTEDGSVMAFEGRSHDRALPTRWDSLWSTYEPGPIASIHTGDAYDQAVEQAVEQTADRPLLRMKPRPWVIVVTRSGRLAVFNDSSPLDRPVGDGEWRKLAATRRPILPGERFDRGHINRPILGSALMSPPPEGDSEGDEGPDRFHTRLAVGTADGEVRILQLRQLKRTGWRGWRLTGYFEPFWRDVHGLRDPSSAPSPDDRPPLWLYRLRRAEAVKHFAPELADYHVSWLLRQYSIDVDDPQRINRIAANGAYPTHLMHVVRLAQAWTEDDEGREVRLDMARHLEAALRAAHAIDDIPLYKAIVRATLARMNRGMSAEREAIAPATYEVLLDVLWRSVDLWRARPATYVRLRILLQQRSADGQSLERVTQTRILSARVKRAADNLMHGDLLLALETLRAVNASIIRSGWHLMRARVASARMADTRGPEADAREPKEDPAKTWRPGPAGDGRGETFDWQQVSPYFDALADFVARLGNSRSGMGDALLHEVVRSFAIGLCVVPTAAAGIAYRTAEANLPEELIGRIIGHLDVLERQGLVVPDWAKTLFRTLAGHVEPGTPRNHGLSLADIGFVADVLDGAHEAADALDPHTLKVWLERHERPSTGDTDTHRERIRRAIGPVNLSVLTHWVRYDLIIRWLEQTANALSQDAALVELESLLWMVHVMAIPPEVPLGQSTPGAEQYAYGHSWQFWHLATTCLRPPGGPPRSSHIGQELWLLADRSYRSEEDVPFDAGPIRSAIELALSPLPEGLPIDGIRADRWADPEAIGAQRSNRELDDQVAPALVIAAPALAEWAQYTRDLMRALEQHNELFPPQIALYDGALAAFEQAARGFRRSAAVQANIVQGVLGHSLLESISDLACHLYELAQVADPLGTLHPTDVYHRQPAGEGETHAPPIAEQLARALTRRAVDAQSIPKNLLLLAELTARAQADGEQTSLWRLFGSEDQPWSVWSTHPGPESDEGPQVSVRVAAVLRVCLQELARNQRAYGEGAEARMAQCAEGFELHAEYPRGHGHHGRLEDLQKSHLQTMIPPHQDRPGQSHGMGLYLSNLALATVGWRLSVKASQDGEAVFRIQPVGPREKQSD